MLWACEINALKEYLAARDKIERLESSSLKAALKPQKAPDILDVQGDTAVISIRGTLSPSGPGWVERFFGIEGTAYSDIVAAASLAQASDDITNVVLDMDTPGGTVSGVDEAYAAIRELSSEKPVTAINRGMVASAGYWLASAADKILATSDVAETGSIGVVLTVRNRDTGSTDIVSANAPLKRPNAEDKDGRAELQRRVDAIENVFFARVAEGRDVSVEDVKERFGRGGLLIANDPKGKDATSVGMIDGVIKSFKPGLNSAGPKTEGTRMDFEARIKELEGALAAVEAERDALKARIDSTDKFLASDSYPSAIKNLAMQVLRGEEEPSTLKGAVVVFDAQKEAAAASAAAQDSAEAPEAASAPSVDSAAHDGTVATYADYEAALKLAKQAAGRE